jgi:hypothetical protein
MNAALRSLIGAALILGSLPAVTIAQQGELRLSRGGPLTVRFQGSQIIGRSEKNPLHERMPHLFLRSRLISI